MTAQTISGPRWLATTVVGRIVECDGVVYALTKCCDASGKGAESGVVCRACHAPVSDLYGWGALATDRAEIVRTLSAWLAPVLEDLAHDFAERVADQAVTR